jgi:Tannase and feruloyl esterase
MAVESKAVITAVYGASPNLSYWNGCSTVGRQALRSTQIPWRFNEILAGARALSWPQFMHAQQWPQLVMLWSNDELPPVNGQREVPTGGQAMWLWHSFRARTARQDEIRGANAAVPL